jgi:hypothetical protein
VSPAHPESTSSAIRGTGAQRPGVPGKPHDWHVPQVALPQHTPSTQLPDAQSPPETHGLPRSPRQVPAPSQVDVPVQVSSLPFSTGAQTPSLPVSAQLWQVPSQAVSQQMPSAQ